MVKAAEANDEPSRRALSELCETYWHPLYVFLRRKGHPPDDAMDILQGFFAHFLSRNYLADLSPDKGRFRSYLLGALRHFASNERDREEALKRGGGQMPVSLNLDPVDGERRYAIETATDDDPEKLFQKRWAMSVVDGALRHLRARYQANRELELYEYLVGFLVGSTAEDNYTDAAERLGMTLSAVRMAVHRLRHRFREALRDQIAETVADESDVDAELHFLFAALAGV